MFDINAPFHLPCTMQVIQNWEKNKNPLIFCVVINIIVCHRNAYQHLTSVLLINLNCQQPLKQSTVTRFWIWIQIDSYILYSLHKSFCKFVNHSLEILTNAIEYWDLPETGKMSNKCSPVADGLMQ